VSNHTLVAVDLAKTVFEIAVSDRPGHVERRRRVPRERFLETLAQLPASIVVMEACDSAALATRAKRSDEDSTARQRRPTLRAGAGRQTRIHSR
jgi:hypothetical protein